MQDLTKLSELAQSLPDDVKQNAIDLVNRMGEVIEGFGDKPLEWRPGILKLVQATSDRTKLPKGATVGSFILGEDLVDQPFNVIPLRISTTRQYWNPDPDNPTMLCSSPNGDFGFMYGDCHKCQFAEFDKENNRAQCNKTLTFLCIAGDFSNVFTVNFSKSNYANGMDWRSTMTKSYVSPYKRIYSLKSETSQKSKNVELIRAATIEPDNKITGPKLDFLAELYRISDLDRKESLQRFSEYIALKLEKGAALLPAPADSGADVVVDVPETAEAVTAKEPSVNPTDVANMDQKSVKGKGKGPNYNF